MGVRRLIQGVKLGMELWRHHDLKASVTEGVNSLKA